MYGYIPGVMNVTRNRVTPTGGCTCATGAGACGTPLRSCAAGAMNPECTLSAVELIMACRAPSGSADTLADSGVSGGDVSLSCSGPQVTVSPPTAETSPPPGSPPLK